MGVFACSGQNWDFDLEDIHFPGQGKRSLFASIKERSTKTRGDRARLKGQSKFKDIKLEPK